LEKLEKIWIRTVGSPSPESNPRLHEYESRMTPTTSSPYSPQGVRIFQIWIRSLIRIEYLFWHFLFFIHKRAWRWDSCVNSG
jgi:hypothetical protein